MQILYLLTLLWTYIKILSGRKVKGPFICGEKIRCKNGYRCRKRPDHDGFRHCYSKTTGQILLYEDYNQSVIPNYSSWSIPQDTTISEE